MLSKNGLSQRQRKQVQSSLGQIDTPLTELTKKKQPNAVQWTEECQKAFNQLKATLMSDPVLRAPDFDKLFLVTTDASKHGVGAVLMQEGLDQEFHPIEIKEERSTPWGPISPRSVHYFPPPNTDVMRLSGVRIKQGRTTDYSSRKAFNDF
ncbi:unnamed protein product [Caretta caretta]